MSMPSAEVWFVDLAACATALLKIERATPRLSRLDCERAARLKTGIGSANAWIAGRTALRCLIEKHAGYEAGRSEFETSSAGRPHLPDHKLSFNVSHTAGAMLIALSPEGALGVDIEAGRSIRMPDERRSRIEDAARALCQSKPLPEASSDRFLQAWVRVEAFAKADGRGLSRVLADAAAYGPRFRSGEVAALTQGSIATTDLDLPPPYRGAIVRAAHVSIGALQYFPALEEDVKAMMGYQ